MRHTVPLPRGWVSASLGELVAILDSQRIPVNAASREARRGETPYYGATGRVGWIDGHIFDEELVLLGEDGAPFLESGKPVAYMIRGKSWVNNHAHVLRMLGGCPNGFLMHQLNQVDYHDYVSGTTRLKLSQKPMRTIPLRVAPQGEQKRIVEAIESYLTRLDNAVALLERVEENLKRYRASVLKAAVEGRLVPTEAELARREGRTYEPASELLKRILAERRARWIEGAAEKARAKTEENARKAGRPWTAKDNAATLEKERAKAVKQYKEPAAPDTTGLPNLPEGWCWASLDQLAASMTNGLAKRRGGYGRLVHVLRLADVLQGEIGGAEPRDILMDDAEVEKYGLEAGDLLSIRVNGSRRLAGSFVPFDLHDEWAFCDHFIRVRLVGDDLTGAYVLGALNTGIARNHIAAGMVTTAGQNTVNQTTLGTAPLALAPAAEQARIAAEVARLTSVAACEERAVSGQVKRGSRLRQSILKWAFEGKLVEQDPKDEPASVLLERIKAERAAAAASSARGKKKRSAE